MGERQIFDRCDLRMKYLQTKNYVANTESYSMSLFLKPRINEAFKEAQEQKCNIKSVVAI